MIFHFLKTNQLFFTDTFIINTGWIVFLSCPRSKFSITSIIQHQWDCIVVVFHLNENGFQGRAEKVTTNCTTTSGEETLWNLLAGCVWGLGAEEVEGYFFLDCLMQKKATSVIWSNGVKQELITLKWQSSLVAVWIRSHEEVVWHCDSMAENLWEEVCGSRWINKTSDLNAGNCSLFLFVSSTNSQHWFLFTVILLQ